jgi:hypothetical protein
MWMMACNVDHSQRSESARRWQRATKRAGKGLSLDGALRPLQWGERRSVGNQEDAGLGRVGT